MKLPVVRAVSPPTHNISSRHVIFACIPHKAHMPPLTQGGHIAVCDFTVVDEQVCLPDSLAITVCFILPNVMCVCVCVSGWAWEPFGLGCSPMIMCIYARNISR